MHTSSAGKNFHRIITYIVGLLVLGYTTFSLSHAQTVAAFDPVSTARLRAGELTRAITGSPREESIVEPPRQQVFETALLLQAGLRALLPVEQRHDVALPGAPGQMIPLS
jgi:hypothetical protein